MKLKTLLAKKEKNKEHSCFRVPPGSYRFTKVLRLDWLDSHGNRERTGLQFSILYDDHKIVH